MPLWSQSLEHQAADTSLVCEQKCLIFIQHLILDVFLSPLISATYSQTETVEGKKSGWIKKIYKCIHNLCGWIQVQMHEKVMDQHPGKGGAFVSRLTPPGGGARTCEKRELRRTGGGVTWNNSLQLPPSGDGVKRPGGGLCWRLVLRLPLLGFGILGKDEVLFHALLFHLGNFPAEQRAD